MDLIRYREKLVKFILEYLDSKYDELGSVNRWGSDVIDKLKPYIINGKLLRGCLVMASAELLSGKSNEEAVKAAAAIEILNSSVLIHDDIFDKDNVRRGIDAMHYSYEQYGAKHDFSNPKHFGTSVGTCVGDVGFFMSMQLLSSMNISSDTKNKMLLLYTSEVMKLGVAEIEDIYLEHSDIEISENEILKMYEYKTAHYTFSLPLTIGAMIAGADDVCMEKLRIIGKNIGLIYQIKDDELGIFSDEKMLGKSVGIDVKADKKTLHRHYLFDKASTEDKKILGKIFGNADISNDELSVVKQMLSKYEITDLIDEKIKNLDAKARHEINLLACEESFRLMLNSLLDYVSYRKK